MASILHFLTLGLLALLSLSAALPSSELAYEKRLLPPAQPQDDAFYTPPAGFESAKPGDVLASRPVAVAVFGLLPQPIQAYQLLYRTTAIDGSPLATVTTVFKPLVGAKLDRFVSFATAEDSNAPFCAPSYTYRFLSSQKSLIVSVENLIIQIYLAQGYIVNSPDYEGPDGAFGAGRLAGTGVLDSMRAVKNFGDKLGFKTADPAIVGVGYSGGAIATGWAASLHSTYASDLNVKGWAAGGTPANLTSVLQFIDGTVWAGFLPSAIQGLNEESTYQAQIEALVDSIATQKGKDALAYTKQHCAVDNLAKFAFQSVQSPEFQTLGDQLLQNPTVQSVLSQQSMGAKQTETPIAPVLLYHSVPDEIIPYADAKTLAGRWCDNGASVKLLTYAAGGHITGELLGAVDVAKYVNDIFDGKVGGACTQETRYDSTLDPIALGLNLEPILLKLVDALGTAGKKDTNVKNDVGTLRKGQST